MSTPKKANKTATKKSSAKAAAPAAGPTRDPDRDSRAPAYAGGNVGDAVGSKQTDAFQEHTHSVELLGNPGLNGVGSFYNPMGVGATGPANNGRRANETRPVNVDVNYIIRSL
jgi:hypothetical protein